MSLPTYSVEVNGDHNDSNIILTSESASITDHAAAANAGAATGSTTVVTTESINYIQPGQYSILMTELQNLPVGFHNWMVTSRAGDMSMTSLFAAEDVFPGSKTKCPGPCVEDADPSNSIWCTALWEDEAVRSYTESLYTYLMDASMLEYVGVKNMAFDISNETGPWAGEVTTDNKLSLILEDLSKASYGTFTDSSFAPYAETVFERLANTNVDVFKFKEKAGIFNFISNNSHNQRWLQDLALLSWAFFNGSFGFGSASPANNLAGSQVIAGIKRETLLNNSLCKLNNNYIRQIKLFSLTEDMGLQQIVDKLNQNPPKNTHNVEVETWFLMVTYGVKASKNAVTLVMCDPYEIPKYETASGEYFQDISSTAVDIAGGPDAGGISVKTYFKATCNNRKQP
jgi:hypothetical protein